MLFLLIFFYSGIVFSQSKKEKSLKAKREKLEKEIAYTNKLLKETRKNKRNTLYELQLLQNKITQRNELITTLKKEIGELEKRISNTDSEIKLMNENIENLKKDYARILVFLSQHNNDLDKLMFLFSSDDLNQAYQRLRYMDELLKFIKKQADTIQSYERSRERELRILKQRKEEKDKLLEQENVQLEKIEQNLAEKDKLKASLSKQENKLRARLREKKREADKLNAKIENIITKETKVKKAPSGKTTYTVSAEDKKISEDFIRNKGKLPWPVDNGFISERFGSHPHPVLKHVMINNNGINIATSTGSEAKNVYKGKVVSVVTITNTNIAVIVKHGNWFTVYSNLDKVYVSRGDDVTAGEYLGQIHTNIKGRTELHFEVWYGKKKQNPAYWIKRK
jgi:septal ring factor EnvC (AmiA/AmiB activator)